MSPSANGTFTYVWDGENRLTAAYKTSPTSTSDKKMLCDYDYMNRRVRKRVYSWTGSAWPDPATATPAKDERYVYDEWNVIAVLDGSNENAIARTFTWGLDLSGLAGDGSLRGVHGAGGIGGLLSAVETGGVRAGSYIYSYDGNGNVCKMLKVAPTYGERSAGFIYDAYGSSLYASGRYAAINPFRFSTKWYDEEISKYYYIYRPYDPRLGRWTSRDPIEESGGNNLYVFVWNRPTDKTDPHGLSDWWCFLTGPCCNGVPYDPRKECCECDRGEDWGRRGKTGVGAHLVNRAGALGWRGRLAGRLGSERI